MSPPTVDYYALLEVPRNASKEQIDKAIKAKKRFWSKQTARPEEEARHRAETAMRHLNEARAILLDAARRAEYDRQLTMMPPAPAGPAGTAIPGVAEDWLALARRASEMDDHHTAVRAAEEARREVGDTPELWGILAQGNYGLARYEDAVFQAQRAVQLEPGNPERHYLLAEIFERMGSWDNALRTYEQAGRVQPGSDLPALGIASVFASIDDPQRAVAVLEDRYAKASDRRLVGDYLAMALQDAAEQVPYVQDGTTMLITSKQEVETMRAMLVRARQVATDPGLHAALTESAAYVDSCGRREFVPRRMFGSGFGLTYLLLGIPLLCCATAVESGGRTGGLVVVGWLVVLAAAGYGLVSYARVPRWRLNLWAHRQEMLQAQLAAAYANQYPHPYR